MNELVGKQPVSHFEISSFFIFKYIHQTLFAFQFHIFFSDLQLQKQKYEIKNPEIHKQNLPHSPSILSPSSLIFLRRCNDL